MHESVMRWAIGIVDQYNLSKRRVLEVGSANVNGSLRPLFRGDYVGVDLRPVSGVDIIANGNELPFRDMAFGVVVCTEMLAHDARPWLTIWEMWRVLGDDGMLLLTTRGPGFGRNDSPHDYFRFTPEAIASLLGEVGFDEWDIKDDPQLPGMLAWAKT